MKLMNVRCRWVLIFFASTLSSSYISCQEPPRIADLVVYGGTASGVMTAYAAARDGLTVVLLEPGSHLGGMVTGGLSATDVGRFTIIGGYVRAYYMKVAAHYGLTNLDSPENWRAEPHVSEEVFDEMVKSVGVHVYFHERLREKGGTAMREKRILSITTEDGKTWRGRVFADCTYEGDLMAEAGVSYTWGREGSAEYGESLAGVREKTPHHQFLWPISAYGANHLLLPEIDSSPLAKPGSGDKKVEAYTFRLILTNDPVNRIPFTRPAGYKRSQFALLARYLREFPQHVGRAPQLSDLFLPVAIYSHKADFNNNGPFSLDYIGHSWKFPEATYRDRSIITAEHLLYVQSLVYFLSHDSAVPESLRAEMSQWGLPKDEFTDSEHWPNQLYIREARRMIGAYVMRQSDVQEQRTKIDSIGMGSYNIDSHNVQRIAMPDETVQNEGNVEVPVEPYEIPYRIITPKRSELQNLLVPVCMSASHVGYSSLRLEPQYMIVGEAAGEAAALAVTDHKAVQEIPIQVLQQKLRQQGAILHLVQEYRQQ